MIKIPEKITLIINTLESSGFEAYAVGGAVRDALLGKAADDWDVTTSALPEQVKACFAAYHVIETGIRHGTVTVVMDHIPVEITTFRFDGDYSDGRHPDSVRFTGSLQEDLARRDFTVNAMAYSPARGLQDPFGGQEDLRCRILRSVGNAHRRFGEDALRILRGVRFAAVLGFEIEAETAAAIHADCPLLRQVSAERIAVELRKMLCGVAADAVIREYPDVLRVCIPALPTGFTESMPMVERLPKRFEVRLAAMLESLLPQGALDACRKLKLDTRTTMYVHDLLAVKDKLPVESLYEMKKLYRRYRDVLEDAFELLKVENAVSQAAVACQRQWHEQILQRGDCCEIGQLAVRGREIASIGCRGEEIGKCLEALLDAVMREEVENEESSLLSAAISWKRSRT